MNNILGYLEGVMIAERIKDYCNDQPNCYNCKFNTNTVGCPFARAPKFWEKQLVQKIDEFLEEGKDE